MCEEIWKPIHGSEKYYISNLGNVKTTNYNKTGTEKLLSPQVHNDGVQQVSLCEGGIVERHLVSRLVAEHFIPNPDSLPNVIHIDGTQNNCVENLQWSSKMDKHNGRKKKET